MSSGSISRPQCDSCRSLILILHHPALETFRSAWLRPIVLADGIVRSCDIRRPLFVANASANEAATREAMLDAAPSVLRGASFPVHVHIRDTAAGMRWRTLAMTRGPFSVARAHQLSAYPQLHGVWRQSLRLFLALVRRLFIGSSRSSSQRSLFDLDGRQPLASHGLCRPARGQARTSAARVIISTFHFHGAAIDFF
jgi:hypothetical protein